MSDAAARREARMRRILENADNRLKKITNVNSSSQCNNTDEPGDVKEPMKPQPIHNEVFHDNTEPFQQVIDRLPKKIKPQPKPTEQKEAHSFYDYRLYVIILLGVLVRYANLIFDQFEELIGIDLAFMRVEKIFLPLLIYEITEVLVFKPQVEEKGAFNLLLMLNNINPDRFKKYFKVLNFVMGILKDMSVYFFAFVILDLLFSVVDIEY